MGHPDTAGNPSLPTTVAGTPVASFTGLTTGDGDRVPTRAARPDWTRERPHNRVVVTFDPRLGRATTPHGVTKTSPRHGTSIGFPEGLRLKHS